MDDPSPKICVFCGSSTGLDPVFTNAASELGNLMARNGMSLVYGGANRGLMGILADTMLEWSAKVYGVIPEMLIQKEVAHKYLTQQYVVSGMHERKALMSELSDAFIILPGGFGTMDELFESITWSQLGIHDKPIVMLNINGYFDNLLLWIENAVKSGFVQYQNGQQLIVCDNPATCIEKINQQINEVK